MNSSLLRKECTSLHQFGSIKHSECSELLQIKKNEVFRKERFSFLSSFLFLFFVFVFFRTEFLWEEIFQRIYFESPIKPVFSQKYSQIIAIKELKFPMLKHSRATSMKYSIILALCFFFTGWKESDNEQAGTQHVGPTVRKEAGKWV